VNSATRYTAKSHAPFPDSKPMRAAEFSLKSFHVAFAGFCVSRQRVQDSHRLLLVDLPEIDASCFRPNEA